jgi:hypothetical protein
MAAAIVMLLVLPLFYALSIGPAFYFGLDSDTHNLLFGPLDATAAAFPPLDRFLHWYVGLWR